jgi:hypothetical protein
MKQTYEQQGEGGLEGSEHGWFPWRAEVIKKYINNAFTSQE